MIVYHDSKFIYMSSRNINKFTIANISKVTNILYCYIKNNINFLGLCAVQIGFLYRLCVVRVGSKILVISNPLYLWKSTQSSALYESCVSIKETCICIKRSNYIVISYKRNNNIVRGIYKYLQSRCIQHEIDHMRGVIISSKKQTIF